MYAIDRQVIAASRPLRACFVVMCCSGRAGGGARLLLASLATSAWLCSLVGRSLPPESATTSPVSLLPGSRLLAPAPKPTFPVPRPPSASLNSLALHGDWSVSPAGVCARVA